MNSKEQDVSNFSLQEYQQSKRAGRDPKAIKAAFQEAWNISDGTIAFKNALEERGYFLAKGNRRGFVAMDHTGEIYSVARWAGIRTKELKERLGDPKHLPSIEETNTHIEQKMKPALKRMISESDKNFQKQQETQRICSCSEYLRQIMIWHKRDFDQTVDIMAVFQGADHYITPTYYPSKAEHDKVVPTWNYAVVHASGPLHIIQDKEWILKHLNELTDSHEKENEVPWSVDDAPQKFVDIQLRGIIGFEIPISKIVGAMKMSQNKNEKDSVGVAQGLRANGSVAANEIAEIVEKNIEKRPAND